MVSRLPYGESWFCFEDRQTVERTIEIAHDLKIPELRTCFSWADWERDGGPEWFDWFIGRLHESGIRLLPCLFYTPLHKARTLPGCSPTTCCPPLQLEDFTAFTNEMLERYGHTFDWIQLWNEPNWQVYWDQTQDPDGSIFAQMINPAIDRAHDYHKRVVIGGLSPYDPAWIERMHQYDVLQEADAVGIHAFPGTWDEGIERRSDRSWNGLKGEIDDLRSQLHALGSSAECWYTETGYSTPTPERESKQIDFFEELVQCGADRTYWHTLIDQRPDTPTDNVLNFDLPHDVRAYHFGLVTADGRRKPVYSHWRKYV